MTREFTQVQACIRGLEACPSQIPFPCPVLDYGPRWMYSPCIWKESFPSRGAAEQKAKEAFLPVYRQAEEWIRRYTSTDNLDSWFSAFHRDLNRRLGNLRDTLAPMRTQQTAPILNRINALLLPDKVLAELEISMSLQDSPHTLSHPGYYLRHTEYSAYDLSEGETGITWLLGKLLIRHGYDLLPVLASLETDFGQKVEDYRMACATQAKCALRKHMITPLQTLLPILYQTLAKKES